jgi:hypothetical protein
MVPQNRMLAGAETFNQPLGTWNVSEVEDMTGAQLGPDARPLREEYE